MTAWPARVTRNGETLSGRTSALLDAAAQAAGIPLRQIVVVQGSWDTGSKSAGTHEGGGAFDLRTWNLTETQRETLNFELRRRNVAAWLRGYGHDNMDPHLHGIVIDEPGLSQAARVQVIDYGKGLNGLANKGKDPYPRPKVVVPFPKTQPPARPMEDDVSVSDARIALAQMFDEAANRSTPSGRNFDNDLKNIIKEATTDLEDKVNAILLALQEQAPPVP